MSIHFEKVNYVYQPNTPFEHQALKNVTVSIPEGSYTAIIGHTGSGKSTLLQHLNGLLKPSSGRVTVAEKVITASTKNKELGDLRKHVGIVFQFPEAQLFEETVLKDIAFAPKNFGKTQAEAEEIAVEMANLVGLPDELLSHSPFELSGGQMRRVAIAGILAMKPEVLVLDEPTAGLDPKGRIEIMQMFEELHLQHQLTIILVTHQMDDVANYADHTIVLEKGEVIAAAAPKDIFKDPRWLVKHHLALPKATNFAYELQKTGKFSFEKMPLTEKELAAALAASLKKGGNQTE
ncbi:ATPase component of general energizing module of ECF transporters [Liquorilactobacillus sucicola DSM 21376 = JCM 15457]|uniref:Energy-coupling factor transporter ATP-binding protein EcfA2 n=1 Tax=Liquorilactobacillus sucicola DSM 21376 = JCM 15457 TaxID=1423806 RepID=A0A023CZM7_9LACO|nr:energy-coupling factor ABC transporter ATP-binding protein [Liquorilactobacillus sucicola]KRN05773.1 cobalt transporter ATP-binding subunit [Liquorilactobacillus sucicola DSM 21376 = JCM 15457]GAJ27244.1 ATPase component of general energizing module of ECF transporters [Liquorilactobacillus sucicola DSM 21376 = JCM 15457]